jgi:hypothetical protein
MGTLERTETFDHRLGREGRFAIKAVSGLLEIKGIDGEEAHVAVRYRIRAADEASAERALDTGRVLYKTAGDRLKVETPERRLSTGLAWLLGGARVSADISAEVPWGTEVRLETMGGSIEASGLTGDQKYRTISGDVRLAGLAGLVDAGALSGTITLDRGGEIWLRANTVSGAIKARADRFRSLALSTTSGGIAIAGVFDPAGEYRADSISGSVELTAMSGVRAELRTISGSIHAVSGAQVEGTRGAWRATVGDGRALLRVHTTSGGLRLVEAEPAAWQGAPSASAAPFAPDAPVPPAPPAVGGWSPAAESAEEEAQEDHEDDQLAILAALERGEIGVDEASALLERQEE